MVWIVLLLTLAAVAWLALYDAGPGLPKRRDAGDASDGDGGTMLIAAGSDTGSHGHGHGHDGGGHDAGGGDGGGGDGGGGD